MGLLVQLTFRRLKFRGPGVFDMSVTADDCTHKGFLIEKHTNGSLVNDALKKSLKVAIKWVFVWLSVLRWTAPSLPQPPRNLTPTHQ